MPLPSKHRAELKRILEGIRKELTGAVQEKIREVRTDSPEKSSQTIGRDQTPDFDIQEDIEFALIQMKADTLRKIDEAMSRLEDGNYGQCFECGDEIAEARLRGLPFAVRCKDCEEARENAQQRERVLARRGRNSMSLFGT